MRTKNKDIEKRMLELITKYTVSMRWRKDYEKWVLKRMYQEKNYVKRVRAIERIIPLKNKRILDLGSGMGGLVVALSLKGFNATGLDMNKDYCKITRLRAQRHGIRVNVKQGVGEKMPFKDNHFDVAMCFDVLEHCRNPQRVLSEIHRVLKPSGVCLITVVNRYGWYDLHYKMPFLNWLPKRIAERYIKLVGREKDLDLFEDRQKYSDLFYFTLHDFRHIANLQGFVLQELSFKKQIHSKNKFRGLLPNLRKLVSPEWHFKLVK